MKRARVDPADFSFSFAVSDDGTDSAVVASPLRAEPGPAVASTLRAPCPGVYAVVTTQISPRAWGSTAVSPLSLSPNTRVKIDWGHASTVGPHVAVETLDGASGVVPASSLTLLSTERDAETRTWVSGTHKNDTAFQFDETFTPRAAGGALPLVIESGLDPLVWPLRPTVFMREAAGRRALCVHATNRLSVIAADFGGGAGASFDAPTMLADASRVVVWMRETGAGGKMQYIDAAPEVAVAAWRAGHSVYFNPALAVQRKYVAALAGDLGLDLAGGRADDLGDVEIFAVRGTHVTPWHWDAQENFTIQCKGTKRWRLRRGALANPITNLHPASSNSAALNDDRRTHRACGLSDMAPPRDDDPEIVTVLLRPGSTLYVPSGFWHSVEADDEGGSVSLNFSMSGTRYADILVRALAQRLWCDERWRARVGGADASAARSTLDALLAELPSVLASFNSHDLIPDGAGGGGDDDEPLRVDNDLEADAPLVMGEYERRPLSVLAVETSSEPGFFLLTISSIMGSAGPDYVVAPQHSTTLSVRYEFLETTEKLMAMQPGERLSTDTLPKAACKPLVQALVDAGYLRAC